MIERENSASISHSFCFAHEGLPEGKVQEMICLEVQSIARM